jgi:hypothetical protein
VFRSVQFWCIYYSYLPRELREPPDSLWCLQLIDCRAMRHSASQMHPFCSASSPESQDERPPAGFVPDPHESRGKMDRRVRMANEIPFGAIHVDAAGIVLEHRQADARVLFPAARIVGRQFIAVAPWAAGPAFLSALKSAIDRSNSSFHFDFKESAEAVERSIHVNILASGDQTAWIFISDKTLPLMS